MPYGSRAEAEADVAHTAQEEPAERELSDLELARRVAFMLHEAREKLQRQQEQQQASAW